MRLSRADHVIGQFPDVWFARHSELAQWALEYEQDEVTYAQRFFAAVRNPEWC